MDKKQQQPQNPGQQKQQPQKPNQSSTTKNPNQKKGF
jgi:hypothetical protein